MHDMKYPNKGSCSDMLHIQLAFKKEEELERCLKQVLDFTSQIL